MEIYVGNKRYSSWSMRGWLAIRVAMGADGFKEKLIRIAGQGSPPEKLDTARKVVSFHRSLISLTHYLISLSVSIRKF